jgi:hypothetical protein
MGSFDGNYRPLRQGIRLDPPSFFSGKGKRAGLRSVTLGDWFHPNSGTDLVILISPKPSAW